MLVSGLAVPPRMRALDLMRTALQCSALSGARAARRCAWICTDQEVEKRKGVCIVLLYMDFWPSVLHRFLYVAFVSRFPAIVSCVQTM